MNKNDISNARNPDLRASLIAINRAALLARKIAIQTDTGIVIVRNQKVIQISADELKEDFLNEKSPTRGS
jgi:hypothetical protein